MSRSAFAAVCTALLLAACGSDNSRDGQTAGSANQTSEQPADTQPRKAIVFFGNSLTAAYQLSKEEGFPALIQQKIDSMGLPYSCVNAGLSGETTADGVNRIEWVLQQPMDIFVLELGANDALRGLPVKETAKNLQLIIDKVRAARADCKIVIAGMQAPPNLGATYTREFRDVYPALASANKAALIPFLLEGVAADPKLNLEDGIHPNVEGQKIVAETVWRTLKDVLSR
ncbi:MAG: arylesterase [Bacteroidota bacterium]|jgi:acyl-CoA thioesterase-1